MPGLGHRRSTLGQRKFGRTLGGAGAAVVLAGSLVAIAAGAGGTLGWSQHATDHMVVAMAEPEAHLLLSEVMAGGASASDEFIEIYNPAGVALPLEGLELVYVSASGATISRKAEWPAGAASVPPGSHLLLANEAGVFASIADHSYAGGLAATGGSVALRIQGAATAIDALGWGAAASTWLEGTPATVVSASHSLERLPGGTAGSGQDTDDNVVDFVDQPVPDPQNAAAPPIEVSPAPSASASTSVDPSGTASPEFTASPTPTPTPALTASPTPTVLSVAAARALPDGSIATIEGVSLTDGAFTDGGGYLADATAGIAVLIDGGTFARGQRLRVTGEVDDRFHQRTLRVDPADVVALGPTDDPTAQSVATGAVGEALEGQLIRVAGEVVSAATQLSGAVAYELDDGSGPARLVVMDATGIAHQAWERGTRVETFAVVGQRDSTGTGSGGYRLLPRDPADVIAALPPETVSPSASASAPGASPSQGPGDDPSPVSIAQARQAPFNARVRVRGVVTLPTSLLHDGTAALQDGSGAIVLRLGDEAGNLALGELVEVDGVRSTKSGMETLRVPQPPLRLGTQSQPDAARHATGALGEDEEATLVVVRGAVASAPRRSSAENVYFDLDDGSGPLRVYVSPRAGVDVAAISVGAWMEVTGVLGQETSGQQPQRGHRLWPRTVADVRLIAAAGGSSGTGEGTVGGGAGGTSSGATRGTPASGQAAASRGPAVDLPIPALSAASIRRASGVAATPDTAPSSAPTTASLAGGSASAPLLALAAAVLAGVAAFATAPSGLAGRVRAMVMARRGDPSAHADGPEPASAVERTVARLVPLAVVDDADFGERVPSTAARSAVRRILPPT